MYAAEPDQPLFLTTTSRETTITDPIQESIKEFREAVENSLHAYEERYRETGNLKIADDELVAEMALEGKVFTPDRALQKLLKIANSVQHIEQVSLDLRSILLDTAEIKVLSPSAQLKLQILNKDTHYLLLIIERDVVPLVHLVPGSQREILTAIKEIKELISYFIEYFEQVVVTRKGKREELASEMSRYLTQFVAKNQLVAVVAIEIVKSRVPLYRLAE